MIWQRDRVCLVATQESSYLVDVIGFNETERLMLSSIFGLAARRSPSFLLRERSSAQRTDLYLVDADTDGSMAEFTAIRGSAHESRGQCPGQVGRRR